MAADAIPRPRRRQKPACSTRCCCSTPPATLASRYLFPRCCTCCATGCCRKVSAWSRIGRSEHDDAGFGDWLRGRLSDERDLALLPELLKRTHYHALDLADPDAVAATLSRYADRPAVSYLSTPPEPVRGPLHRLDRAGLLRAPSRLVLEKPIGHDLDSARAIDATLKASLDESRIFRIDHYLGKAPVQNLLALRFGNTLLEAVWHNRWIESVDVLDAETAGVDGREGYYAGYGAARHGPEPHAAAAGADRDGTAGRARRRQHPRRERKVLRSLRPMTAPARPATACGRYTDGVVEGQAVKGFVHDGEVETFVALRAWIDNWRWTGVPFTPPPASAWPRAAPRVVVTFSR